MYSFFITFFDAILFIFFQMKFFKYSYHLIKHVFLIFGFKNFGDFLFLIETVFVVNFSWELGYIYIFSFFIHIIDLVLRENKQTSLHY